MCLATGKTNFSKDVKGPILGEVIYNYGPLVFNFLLPAVFERLEVLVVTVKYQYVLKGHITEQTVYTLPEGRRILTRLGIAMFA